MLIPVFAQTIAAAAGYVPSVTQWPTNGQVAIGGLTNSQAITLACSIKFDAGATSNTHYIFYSAPFYIAHSSGDLLFALVNDDTGATIHSFPNSSPNVLSDGVWYSLLIRDNFASGGLNIEVNGSSWVTDASTDPDNIDYDGISFSRAHATSYFRGQLRGKIWIGQGDVGSGQFGTFFDAGAGNQPYDFGGAGFNTVNGIARTYVSNETATSFNNNAPVHGSHTHSGNNVTDA